MEFKTFLNFISLKSTLMNRNSHKNSLFIYSMKFLNELKKLTTGNLFKSLYLYWNLWLSVKEKTGFILLSVAWEIYRLHVNIKVRCQKRTFRHIYVILKDIWRIKWSSYTSKICTKEKWEKSKKKTPKNKNETVPTIDILSMVLKNNMHVSKMF